MMQSIPASQISNVTPGVVSAGGTGLDTIGLGLTTTPFIPIGVVQSFATQGAVAAYFGATSPEANFAQNYFAGFDGSDQKPGSLLMAQYPQSAVPAFLRGGNVSALTLAQLQAINGTLSVVVNGVTYTAGALNLAAATSFSNAAGLIATALAINDASFTGVIAPAVGVTSSATTIAGTTMTVAAMTSGAIVPMATVTGGTTAAGTKIVSQLTGTPGGVGTYQVSISQTVAAAVLTATNAAAGVLTASSVTGALATGQIVAGAGVTAGTTITAPLNATGGAGTYILSASQTVSSEAMTSGAATVIFGSVQGSFKITGGTPGAVSTIGYASGTTAAALGLTQATGAVLSQGAAAATPGGFMAGVVLQTQDWVSFATLFEPSVADKVSFAQWADGQNNRYIYAHWSTEAAAAVVPDTTSSGALILAAGYSGTILTYAPVNGAAAAAFVMGSMASVNFNETNGRATLAFRSQSGLLADVNNLGVYTNLQTNGYNSYATFGTANDQFTFFYPGSITGEFNFSDTYLDQVWLNNAFQLAGLALLIAVKSIPYTKVGDTLIAAGYQGTINAAVKAGVIRAGVQLSPAQIAEINNAAGFDVATTLQNRGWYLLSDAAGTPAAMRQARKSPLITFWYCDGGSIQQLNMSSLAVL